MRYAPVAMALMALCIGTTAFGGANPQFTFPMHGLHPATFQENCATVADIDCLPGGVRPTVNLPGPLGGPGVVYFFVNNHNELKGAQTAFDFGTWSLVFGNWTCQPGFLALHVPTGSGPDDGLLNAAWNCFAGTQLQTIGFMTMNMPSGCITQVLPTGSLFQALDCDLNLDEHDGTGADAARLGSVCVDTGGVDACDAVNPVESATWGSIKAQYK
jgi:hypothetical protein